MTSRDNHEFDIIIGAHLRTERLEQNLTTRQVANTILGLSSTSLSHHERGINSLSVQRLRSLCRALNLSVPQLWAACEQDLQRCPIVWVPAHLLTEDPAFADLVTRVHPQHLVQLDRKRIESAAAQRGASAGRELRRLVDLSREVIATSTTWHEERSLTAPAPRW